MTTPIGVDLCFVCLCTCIAPGIRVSLSCVCFLRWSSERCPDRSTSSFNLVEHRIFPLCACILINDATLYLILVSVNVHASTSAIIFWPHFFIFFLNASQPQLSVRAFRQVERFSKDNEKKLIVNLSCYLNQGAVQLWLGLRLNWITTAILLVVAIFCVVQHQLSFSFSVRI